MDDYKLLTWDSRFFGFPVARILPPSLDATQLPGIIQQLKERHVRLAFWRSPIDSSRPPGDTIEQLGGVLVDHRTTFRVELPVKSHDEFNSMEVVRSYQAGTHDAALHCLAVQAGEYSRTARDPKIPHEKFAELYTIWMTRAIQRRLADEVLVIDAQGVPVAMATVGMKQQRGNIGLLAVDKQHRRRGYGRLLVHAALQRLVGRDVRECQVVTQRANVPACRLYEKCGFRLEKVELYYHFWL